MTKQQTISAIADAIDRMEGPGAPRNNPGNLRTWGSLPTQGGFAVFPDIGAGRAALERQVELNIGRGLTLEQFFGGKPGVYAGYAPGADSNDPARYAANVSQWTGIPLGVPLNQVVVDGGGNVSKGIVPAGSVRSVWDTVRPNPLAYESYEDPVFSIDVFGSADAATDPTNTAVNASSLSLLIIFGALLLFAASRE